MTIEEYLAIRENLLSLNGKITDWAQDKFNVNNAAKLLGFMQNGVWFSMMKMTWIVCWNI